MPRASRRPPPNHLNPDFWPEVEGQVLLLAQEDGTFDMQQFTTWWDKLRTAAGNANAYATKGNAEQVAQQIVAEYRGRINRAPATR